MVSKAAEIDISGKYRESPKINKVTQFFCQTKLQDAEIVLFTFSNMNKFCDWLSQTNGISFYGHSH